MNSSFSIEINCKINCTSLLQINIAVAAIPANTTVTMLLDQTYLTNAYPTFRFNKGKDAGISLSYAESLFDNIIKYGMRKSNRNEVEGKDFSGRKDSLISNGGA